jgi:hypothetical protein
LVVNALGVTALINVVINFGIAWLGTRGVHTVALWAVPMRRPSTIADTLGTTFMLPFITALTCSRAVERELRIGRIPQLPQDSEVRRLLEHLPRRVVPRALRIASLTMLVIGPAALATLLTTRFGGVSVPAFLIFKVAFAVSLGVVVTPVVALAAMSFDERSIMAPEPASPIL